MASEGVVTQAEVIKAFAELDKFQDTCRNDLAVLQDQRNKLDTKIIGLRRKLEEHEPRREDLAKFCTHVDEKGRAAYEPSSVEPSVVFCRYCKHAKLA